jgi:SAM-dependent methyltransferase
MSSWNEEFYKEGGKSEDPIFRIPHKDFPEFVRLLKEQNAENVLDLGCGTGRHVIALAKEGFTVYGLDVAERAVERTRQWLQEENLSAHLQIKNFYEQLPYNDTWFDGILALKAINHATAGGIRRIFEEIRRIMKPTAVFMAEVAKWEPELFDPSRWEEFEPRTLRAREGSERELTHYFFESESEVRTFMSGFEIVDIHETEKGRPDTPTAYFTVLAKLKD